METGLLEVQSQSEERNGNMVIQLKGKLSLETVKAFIQRMRLEAAAAMILDMGGVSFLDSSGVGALVSIFVSRKHAGKKLKLAALTKQGVAVMQVSGLMKLIPTYATVNEAAAA